MKVFKRGVKSATFLKCVSNLPRYLSIINQNNQISTFSRLAARNRYYLCKLGVTHVLNTAEGHNSGYVNTSQVNRQQKSLQNMNFRISCPWIFGLAAKNNLFSASANPDFRLRHSSLVQDNRHLLVSAVRFQHQDHEIIFVCFCRISMSPGASPTKVFRSSMFPRPTSRSTSMMSLTLQTSLWELAARFSSTVRWECPAALLVFSPTSC